jgi:hypothetical protein
MIDDGDCEAIDGMKIDMEKLSTWRKSAPAPQIPNE